MTSAPDQLRLIRDHAVRIERLLTSRGAVGEGLLRKARSLPPPLDGNVLEDLKIVAHLRNQVMHEGQDLTRSQLERFEEAAIRAERALAAPVPPPATVPRLSPTPEGARKLPGQFYERPLERTPRPDPKGLTWVAVRFVRVLLGLLLLFGSAQVGTIIPPALAHLPAAVTVGIPSQADETATCFDGYWANGSIRTSEYVRSGDSTGLLPCSLIRVSAAPAKP